MSIPLEKKSTIQAIQQRFDQEVERFSHLDTGQQATLDAPLVLELVAQACRVHLQPQAALLDLGCGAGNFTLRILQEVQPLECHLVDLSELMLERAKIRLAAEGSRVWSLHTYAADLRTLTFPEEHFHAILAGAVLHHLREEEDWKNVFSKLYRWLKPGGRLYVADLITFDQPDIQGLMWQRYGDYLQALGGQEYQEKVFQYIDQEDSPRSLPFQIQLLQRIGFAHYDVLHRNSVFACYVATK